MFDKLNTVDISGLFSEVHGRLIVGHKIWVDFLILKRRMQRRISDKLLYEAAGSYNQSLQSKVWG